MNMVEVTQKKRLGEFTLNEIKAECDMREYCDNCPFEKSEIQACNIAKLQCLDEEIEIKKTRR